MDDRFQDAHIITYFNVHIGTEKLIGVPKYKC